MRLPTQITFRELAPSRAIEAYTLERVSKLDRSYGKIMRCRVVVAAPHRHQRHGARYDVHIELTVPGEELVISRARGDLAHTDIYACIDATFDDAHRVLEDYARRRRGEVKHHEPTPRGRVAHLASYEGFGFLETAAGDRIYFHRNSVLHGAFDRLQVGDRVRFAPEEGREGPQASTVELVRPQRRHAAA